MPSVTEHLNRRSRLARGGNVQRQHDELSPDGSKARKGKWHNLGTLRKYRKARDKARQVADVSRMRNRA